MVSLPFLGACEVCGKLLRNYRGLAGHLRHNTDLAHRELQQRWSSWKTTYRATLRCFKCGELFEISAKAESGRKRCPRCEELRASLGKRGYEAVSFEKAPDPRRFMTAKGSKAQWEGLDTRSVQWSVGDDLYVAVVDLIQTGSRLSEIRTKLGISYKVLRTIGEDAFSNFQELMLRRKITTMLNNVELARTDSKLEHAFAAQLKENGYRLAGRNSWLTLRIGGSKVKREADIKVAVGDGRKIVVLCDGEAFHGPRVIRGNPADRIAHDRETALAFFELGYSVLRYSESEIHDGSALTHFHEVMSRLNSTQKIYRNWCPAEELVA